MAKKTEYKDMPVDELKALARDLEQQHYQMRNELALQKKLEKPHLLKLKRKEKARVLTALTQKQKQQEAV